MKTEPKFYAQVIWMDRTGRGRMRGFHDGGDLDRFLTELRCDADIRNVKGEIVGGVWADDRDGNRGKWRWIYDADELELVGGQPK